MKNVSTLQSLNTASPKTPGGISRSLLTPCRRVGLSRNFRKSGASPFQSPLSSKTDVKEEKGETRKRKEFLDETAQTPENRDDCGTISGDRNGQTPTRTVELPRRKKSKTLIASINKISENNGPLQENVSQSVMYHTNSDPCKSLNKENIKNESSKNVAPKVKDSDNTHNNSKEAVTPLRLKSKSRSINRNISNLSNSFSKQPGTGLEKEKPICNIITEPKVNEKVAPIEKSPNNLTKECIVVIQKKIFKKELNEKPISPMVNLELNEFSTQTKKIISQPVFDSDSDDIPLNCLNKDSEIKPKLLNTIDEDDQDFVSPKAKLSKPVKAKSKTKLTSPAKKANINSKIDQVELQKVFNSQTSDDDDFFEKKRTIIIRKTYDKLSKPLKAKSTGSITQKDIDDLKARIETKKKMLLARTLTEDTKELRDLVKKWQKGCQDALMELMDLMKSKFPDKRNMDYSEILQTLKIPSTLVGYDSDNDCFVTPDDETIVLARV